MFFLLPEGSTGPFVISVGFCVVVGFVVAGVVVVVVLMVVGALVVVAVVVGFVVIVFVVVGVVGVVTPPSQVLHDFRQFCLT